MACRVVLRDMRLCGVTQENCGTFLMMVLPNKYGLLNSGYGAIYFPLGNMAVSGVIFSLGQYSAINNFAHF